MISLRYRLTKALQLGSTLYVDQVRIAEDKDDFTRFQIDLLAKL